MNSWEKGWMNANKKILLLKEGQTTDESLSLQDKVKVYTAKKTTSATVHLVDVFMNTIPLSNTF